MHRTNEGTGKCSKSFQSTELEWPPQSPDLNPAENLRAVAEQEICSRQISRNNRVDMEEKLRAKFLVAERTEAVLV